MSEVPRITKEDVARIAQLARIYVTEEELASATKDLAGVLGHFSAIQDINTQDIPTADDASGLTGVVREDKALPQELALHEGLINAAPQKRDGHIEVKAVF